VPCRRSPIDGLELAHTLVDLLADKKGEDILLLDLSAAGGFTDYFIICSGASERTLGALADEAVRGAKRRHHVVCQGQEGTAGSGWILLDFGAVVVHLFVAAVRRYYALEELWRSAPPLVHMP
jgi:ribosome-associated protein